MSSRRRPRTDLPGARVALPIAPLALAVLAALAALGGCAASPPSPDERERQRAAIERWDRCVERHAEGLAIATDFGARVAEGAKVTDATS